MSDDQSTGGETIRQFQINEPDLAELERMIPSVVERHQGIYNDPKTRVMLRKVRDILSLIRWRYGPSREVGDIPADGGDQ